MNGDGASRCGGAELFNEVPKLGTKTLPEKRRLTPRRLAKTLKGGRGYA